MHRYYQQKAASVYLDMSGRYTYTIKELPQLDIKTYSELPDDLCWWNSYISPPVTNNWLGGSRTSTSAVATHLNNA